MNLFIGIKVFCYISSNLHTIIAITSYRVTVCPIFSCICPVSPPFCLLSNLSSLNIYTISLPIPLTSPLRVEMFLHPLSSHHLRSISSNNPQDPRAWFWRASRTCCAKGRLPCSPNAPHSQRLDGEWGSSSPAQGPTYRYSILAGVKM